MNKKFLSVLFHDSDGNLVPHLCKCPAAPDTVMAALQFLTEGNSITISVSDFPFDYVNNKPIDLNEK